jgi:hypothetical protein
MHIERLSFSDTPEQITVQTADCLWILLSERESPRPLQSAALQWVDWRLHGLISRFLLLANHLYHDERGLKFGSFQPGAGQQLREKPGDPLTTFVPTMNKLAYPLVAIDGAGRTDWKNFHRNCEGMQMKEVIFFCEESSRLTSLEKEFRKQSNAEFPQHVMFGHEKIVEKG